MLKSDKPRKEIGMQDFLKGSMQDSAVALSLQLHEVMTQSGFWQGGCTLGLMKTVW